MWHRKSRIFLFMVSILLWQCFNPLFADSGVSAAERVPGEILIDLRDSATADEVKEFQKRYGLELHFNSPFSGRQRLYLASLPDFRISEIVSLLSKDPLVEAAEPEYLYRAFSLPNDPLYKYQWHMHQIDVASAWRFSKGEGVTVAVIDTGVAFENYQHFHRVEDLEGTRFVPGYNFISNTTHANDDHGHGTHVAGTIAQATDNSKGVVGIAYRAAIMPLKVLSASGSGTVGDIAEAIRFAADRGAKIINMSLGGPFPSKVLGDACNYANRKGVLIICAAGNSSSSWVSYPAAYPVCVAVSAVRYDKTLAFYSNRGRRIDIAAPGGDMNVDQNGDGYKDGVLQNTIAIRDPSREDYSLFQGTSMAAPHVAGSAALIMSLGVTNPWEVKKILFSTARTPPEERSKGYGAGILNANVAVHRVVVWRGVKKVTIALFFLVALFLLRKKLPRLSTSLCCGIGLLAGSSGFFFLPFFAEIPEPVAPFLTRGVGDWDIFWLGAQAHVHPLFYSAFAPLILAALFHKWGRSREVVAGFSVGVASVILSCFFAPSMMGHSFPLPIEKLWLLTNGVACLGLGLSLVSKEDKR